MKLQITALKLLFASQLPYNDEPQYKRFLIGNSDHVFERNYYSVCASRNSYSRQEGESR